MWCIFQIAVLLINTNYCILAADAFSYSPHQHKKLIQFHSSSANHGENRTTRRESSIHLTDKLIHNNKRVPLPRYSLSCLFSSQDDTSNNNNESSNKNSNNKTSSSSSSETSKRQMLKFAIPALGIYLTNPLLSNIDNAFVGRTVGAMGLAALSPATLCIDQMLYLFSFLSRATTGLASRAYSNSQQSTNNNDDINSEAEEEEAAKTRMKEAASPAFSISIFCGVIMSLLYLTCVPQILQVLNVDPLLHTSATSYIHWRGAISWAAMSQAVLLSLFMVMKDAVTPLKIIASAAIFNVLGDGLFCVWPLR